MIIYNYLNYLIKINYLTIKSKIIYFYDSETYDSETKFPTPKGATIVVLVSIVDFLLMFLIKLLYDFDWSKYNANKNKAILIAIKKAINKLIFHILIYLIKNNFNI